MKNKIRIETMTLTASVDDLKASKCVLKKIGFNESELAAVKAAGIDTTALDEAKAAGDKQGAIDNAIIFFKIDAKGTNNNAIVAMVDNEKRLYINKNCDFTTLGAGGIATRLRLGALYNCFIDTFTDSDIEPVEYNGVTIKCEKSLVDARRQGKPTDDSTVDW